MVLYRIYLLFLFQIHESAREKLYEASGRQKREYDTRSNLKAYEPGSLVFVFNTARKKGVSPKLSLPWLGPFEVLARVDDWR